MPALPAPVLAALVAVPLAVLPAPGGVAAAQDRPPGITEPVVLPPHDPNAARCTPPAGVSRKLVFVQDNRRDFMQGARRGLEAAAASRGLAFEVALADNDAARMKTQVQAMLADGVGAVVVAPIDPLALAPDLRALIWAGRYVGTIVPPPAVSLLNAPQYLTGRALGDAAAAHIRERLGGRANVVLLTHDTLQFLAPRFAAMRDALNDLRGVTIVADISPSTVDKEGGYRMMQTILLAHPDIDVVLGADTVVLGAMAAVRDAGKIRPTQFFGGIDGEPEAVAEIRKGGVYRASISLASPIFGYAMGQHAADWLEGRSIPQAMDILPIALTSANLQQYEADLREPGRVFDDAQLLQRYLRMYGNICYDQRANYINFPWSSERRR